MPLHTLFALNGIERRGVSAGAMFAAVMLMAGAQAHAVPIELVTNGGFETGTLAGWTNSGLGAAGQCPFSAGDWNVSTTGSATGCSAVADPAGSTFAAYVMNDGPFALNYLLMQTFSVAANTIGGTFSFDLSSLNSSDADRTLTVSLTNLDTLVSINLYSASTSSRNDAWQVIGGDISPFLLASAGDQVTLEFDNFIPSSWTGLGGLGIDNVSILAVPEPSTALLLGLGLTGLAANRRRLN